MRSIRRRLPPAMSLPAWDAKYGPQQTLELQPGVGGLDTNLREANADSNYHTSATNYVGYYTGLTTFRTVIKFDLSVIASGSYINSATFQMTMTGDFSSSATNMQLFRLLRNWVVDQATWNSYSTGNAWQTAGGFGALDAEQTPVATRAFSATEANGDKTWTVDTDSVKEWVDGDASNYGWLIKTSVETNDGYGFKSNDDGTAAGRPKLTIVYQAPL